MFAFRCGKCRQLFIPDFQQGEVCGEIDYVDKEIRYICRNKECGFENVMDHTDWKKKQEHSPLPRPIIGEY